MNVNEGKAMASDAVLLFACVLEALDKLDDNIKDKTRTETALGLTCAMLRLDK